MSSSQNQIDRNICNHLAHEHLHLIEDNCFENGTVTRYTKGNFLGKGGFARCYELIS